MDMQARQIVPFDVFGMRDDVRVSTMVRVGDKGWTCGLCPLDRQARVVSPGDLGAQAVFVADMIAAVFARAGFGANDVAKLVIYHAASSKQETQALLASFQRRFPKGPVLVPVAVPYFYYAGMLLEVDAYADASLLPRAGSVSGSVQARQGQDLTYVAASAETREGVYDALKAAGFPPSNPLLQNEFWAEHTGDTQPLSHSGVMLPAGSDGHVVDLLLSDQCPVVHDDAQPFMSVRAAGDLFVFTASHPELDLSLVDQTRAVMRQLDAGLSRHGLTWAHVVKVSAPYVGGGTEDDLHQNLKIRHSYHVRPGPASTGLPVRAFVQTGTRICVQLLAHR